MSDPVPTDSAEARRHWMGVLGKAPCEGLERAWSDFAPEREVRPLRPAEHGLVMVRGRMGGVGRRFNLGEATVTRCAVIIDERIGHACVLGRDKRKAELAARFDALLQDPELHEQVMTAVVEPLRAAEDARQAVRARKAAATKVDFFTLARGAD